MSKTHVFARFDIYPSGPCKTVREDAADGALVLAEDAINREAVLQAQIRTLEAQLKDARAEAARFELAAHACDLGGYFEFVTDPYKNDPDVFPLYRKKA